MNSNIYDTQRWWNKLDENWLSILEIISQFSPENIKPAINLKNNKDKDLWFCIETAYDNIECENDMFPDWVKKLPNFLEFLELEKEGWILFEEQ